MRGAAESLLTKGSARAADRRGGPRARAPFEMPPQPPHQRAPTTRPRTLRLAGCGGNDPHVATRDRTPLPPSTWHACHSKTTGDEDCPLQLTSTAARSRLVNPSPSSCYPFLRCGVGGVFRSRPSSTSRSPAPARTRFLAPACLPHPKRACVPPRHRTPERPPCPRQRET